MARTPALLLAALLPWLGGAPLPARAVASEAELAQARESWARLAGGPSIRRAASRA